jgi:hypothetical protein
MADYYIFNAGGYGKVSPADIRDSNKFIDELVVVRPDLKFEIAAGATISYTHPSSFLKNAHLLSVYRLWSWNRTSYEAAPA